VDAGADRHRTIARQLHLDLDVWANVDLGPPTGPNAAGPADGPRQLGIGLGLKPQVPGPDKEITRSIADAIRLDAKPPLTEKDFFVGLTWSGGRSPARHRQAP
jgi:hypothetical protein